MLIIQPTADGRLHIHNNHRSDFARDEASARSLAYNWGHTDISINKALSEMRASSRGESSPAGWRVARPAPVKEPAAAKEPAQAKKPAASAREPEPAPSAAKLRGERRARKEAAAKSAAPEPKPAAELKPAAAPKPAAAARPAPAPTPAAEKPAAEKPKPAPRARAAKPAAPETTEKPAAPPRDRALAHIRAGVKELLALEGETLPFARAPWSDLREMAEYISACLEGKRPKSGWVRENK
jgi:hypothetical protein